MIYKREITPKVLRFAQKFPVVAILGPRQSGKTTLARETFKDHVFINFENPELREFASSDPNGFLAMYANKEGIILDEFQYVPQLLSYIQVLSDEKKRLGYFILTGSQNFLMNKAITQSLAGRVGILTLLPLSILELKNNNLLEGSDEIIIKGGYPKVYADNIEPYEIYPSYVRSYVERDVRELANVGDLQVFQKFMKLCAGRVGQQLNVSDIATNCGVERRTVNQWLSILQASYIIFLLPPYYNNFNKRLTKSPKLYFLDTGLACSLLGIRSFQELQLSPFKGSLFENFIIADFNKQFYNQAFEPSIYYWRDLNGTIEVDCILDVSSKLIPVEIKSGQTINKDLFEGFERWNKMAQLDPQNGYIVYAGDLEQKRNIGHVIGWQDSGDLISLEFKI